MKFLVIAWTFWWSSTAAFAAESTRPQGLNCQLESPPASAGESPDHGVVYRVYPRAKDIDARYSGCQALLVPDHGQWSVVALTEIVRGDPVRLWMPDPRHEVPGLACRYQAGRVVRGDAASCPAPQGLIQKSMAPGCAARLQAAAGKDDTGSSVPAACDLE